ncbi:secreted protein [gut metagenome]|uniref:Secreted protein n=1 Tax=gut metagenome TaxID=749906 RepID=J9CQR2_9ZZZZ
MVPMLAVSLLSLLLTICPPPFSAIWLHSSPLHPA